jgi:hypothetical protein
MKVIFIINTYSTHGRVMKFVAILLILTSAALAAGGPTFTGTVLDPDGAIIPGATIYLLAEGKSTLTARAGEDGSFSFAAVPAGHYKLTAAAPGFAPYHNDAIEIATTPARLEIKLAMAATSEVVEVAADSSRLDTLSAQNGDILGEKKLASIPLNGRSMTDLLALQPGVVPASSAQPNAVVMSGCTSTPPSGDLNPGNLSVSGQRETANGFTVNGSLVEERFNNGAAVIPVLDSIQDLTVLTSNFNAEYGNFSGGQITVVTKSGGDKLHGSAFEFMRNTALDSRNYFATDRASYDRNQYGGTLGGPIRRGKSYFFLDYQGTQMTQGQETGNITVPTLAARSGNFTDLASQLTGSVSSAYWASRLTQQLGYAVTSGESYYTPGCTSSSQCVFPNAKLPVANWSAPAQNLLKYIPSPTSGGSNFSDSSQNEGLGDNKAAARIDIPTRFGAFSGYYFFDQYSLNNPYPTSQGGANVPGFNALSNGRAQLISLGLTKSYGSRTMNEARFSYMRFANVIGQPVGGVGPSLASQGFVEGVGTLGIVPLNTAAEGVENVAFNDFSIGVDTTGETQVNNMYQWSDNFSHVFGHHTLKLGGSFHLDQVNIRSNSINNGAFVFSGTETGSDFADFALGIASNYEQGNAAPFYIRNKYIGAFAQDTWQLRPGLTLDYGVRWDVLPPWREKYNQLQTFVLGEQSKVYPGAPEGIVFPGDPGIPSTLAPTKWTNFSPRLGLSWAPHSSDPLFSRLLNKSTVHAGFGIFYSAFEGLSAGIMSACAPYGYDYDSTGGRPLFNEPFVSATTGTTNGQPFPSPMPVLGASASHPNTTVDWAKYNPITGDPAFYYRNTSPYTESYSLSIERELARNTTLKLGYVGSQAHHLLVLTSADPGNAALCLSVSQTSQVAPGTATCGPFSEGGVFTRPDGTQVHVRGPFNESFDGITYQKTDGFSNYNSFEASVHHTSQSLDVSAGYTYGKSIDDSSSLAEPIYPQSASLSKAISAFDLRHNFVVSYRYRVPFAMLLHNHPRFSDGWSLSGLTRFTTGLPVTLYNNTDSSLLGSIPNGINNNGVDTPKFTPGNLHLNTNPRGNTQAFNTDLFSVPAEGTLGNAPRRFFYGPGLENFDMALQKELPLAEGKMLMFRAEAFNLFNHAQFFGPAAVNGNISSTGFGQIVNAMPPRQIQLAMKFTF